MRPDRLRTLAAGLGVAAAVATGCAGPVAPAGPAAAGDGTFPVTVRNCGRDLTVPARPERIFLIDNGAVPDLEALGAVDRVVAVTAPLERGLFAQGTYQRFDALGTTSTTRNATGGSIVSHESILAATPDLVIAADRAVDRAALQAAGIPLYVPSAYCATADPATAGPATFDRVWDELRAYGRILGETGRAEQAAAAARAALPPAGQAAPERTAAALYVSSGGKVLSPYGAPSMVTPVFEAAGLRNVYADVDQRVFDANVEDIVARDPGTIVLLHSGDTAEATLAAFRSAPGTAALRAVRENRIVTLPFPYTDPPSLLSTRGPEQLRRLLAATG